MSCLLRPYLVILISFIRCVKKLFTFIKSASMSLFALLFFFNFHGETQMYAVWSYIIFVCEHYLKVKLFHVFVRVVGSLFFCVDVLDHALVDKVERSGMYFAISVSYFPVDISCLIFLTLFLASS